MFLKLVGLSVQECKWVRRIMVDGGIAGWQIKCIVNLFHYIMGIKHFGGLTRDRSTIIHGDTLLVYVGYTPRVL